MALPDSAKLVVGTPIVLADLTDHGPATNNNLGTRTDQIDCTDLADQAARQSDKINFGTNMDLEYILSAAIEWEASPEVAAGDTVDFYMGWSNSSTPGVANSAGVSGTDLVYEGYPEGSLVDSLKQLDFLGSMVQDGVITTDQTQIDMDIATFTPRQQFGTLIIFNNAATNSAAFHSDMDETSFVFTPLVLQIQD